MRTLQVLEDSLENELRTDLEAEPVANLAVKTFSPLLLLEVSKYKAEVTELEVALYMSKTDL